MPLYRYESHKSTNLRRVGLGVMCLGFFLIGSCHYEMLGRIVASEDPYQYPFDWLISFAGFGFGLPFVFIGKRGRSKF